VALAGGLLALGALAGLVTGVIALPHRDGVSDPGVLEQLTLTRRPLIIESTPSGASIHLGGALVGQTPWAGDAPAAPGAKAELTLSGYEPWAGPLPDGELLQVTLTRSRGPTR
jgi:hypothetical protein